MRGVAPVGACGTHCAPCLYCCVWGRSTKERTAEPGVLYGTRCEQFLVVLRMGLFLHLVGSKLRAGPLMKAADYG
jgi:hypothetical protein